MGPSSKKIAIVQSNYIPWKGYFSLIRSVDEFILYDDAQYTRRDWRNRNRIKTSRGPVWLTVPVETKGKRLQAVKDVRISEAGWGKRHWRILSHAYGRAACFKKYGALFETLYLKNNARFLSEVNRAFIEAINGALGIDTPVLFSMDYEFDRSADTNEKLLQLCMRAGATDYLSGPAAKEYLDTTAMKKEGITVKFADYSAYPEYPQLFSPFIHEVSVLDLLFNTGDKAARYMKELF